MQGAGAAGEPSGESSEVPGQRRRLRAVRLCAGRAGLGQGPAPAAPASRPCEQLLCCSDIFRGVWRSSRRPPASSPGLTSRSGSLTLAPDIPGGSPRRFLLMFPVGDQLCCRAGL